jgi:hypothetical protein
VGSQSHPADRSRQPEASLAWRWGDPPCEAETASANSPAIEPRNGFSRGSPRRLNGPGPRRLPAMAWGSRSRRGLRNGRKHNGVPQEPGRPALSSRKFGLGVPNPKLPGSRPGIQGRGERTTGGSEGYRRAKTRSPVGRKRRSRSVSKVPQKPGNRSRQDPVEGRGTSSHRTVGGKRGRGIELWNHVYATTTDS